MCYHYCTTSFNKVWAQVLRRFKSFSRRVGDSRWWECRTMAPAGNKAKRLSSVNHSTTTIHHHHHHQLHTSDVVIMKIKSFINKSKGNTSKTEPRGAPLTLPYLELYTTYFGSLHIAKKVIKSQWQSYLVDSIAFQFWLLVGAFDKSIKIVPANLLCPNVFCQEWGNLNNACWILCAFRIQQFKNISIIVWQLFMNQFFKDFREQRKYTY